MKGSVTIALVAENTYRFTFSEKRDRDNIYRLRPWSFQGSLLILKECSVDIAAKRMEFKTMTFFRSGTWFSTQTIEFVKCREDW